MSPDHPDNLRLRVIVSCALILLVLLVGVGAFAGLASLSKDPEKAARKAPRTVVRVVLATRGEFKERIGKELSALLSARDAARGLLSMFELGLMTGASPRSSAGP